MPRVTVPGVVTVVLLRYTTARAVHQPFDVLKTPDVLHLYVFFVIRTVKDEKNNARNNRNNR
jgi:hypothetical protein